MPSHPIDACEWLLPKLTAALTESKILPIRLQHLKHQDVLRSLVSAKLLSVSLQEVV